MYDLTHDYEISFFYAGGAILAATSLQLGLSVFKRRSNVRQARSYACPDIELPEVDQTETGFKKAAVENGRVVSMHQEYAYTYIMSIRKCMSA